VALAGVAAFAVHLGWQLRRLDISDAAGCLTHFRSNRDVGLILTGGLVLAAEL
jgi:4-hydroxybenzoate polyprenyltransferase